MATKFTAGTVINAGLIVVGVDADAPPATPSPAPEPAPVSEPQILPLSRAVSLLMDASATADGSVVDGSTNNHSITVNGDVSQSSFSPYRSGGYSWEFDGNGDQLSFSHAGFGTGDFTVEGWVFPENQGNRFPLCFEFGSLISVQYDREDIPGKFIVGGLQAADNCPSGQWYHIAAVRESGTLTLYVNGVAADSKTYTDNLSAHTAFIGGSSGVSSELAFKGKMSDVRFTNAAVYTTDFTPPTERLTEVAGTSLLTCNLPYLQSGLTAHGDASPVAAGPYDYVGYSESLHGGSYVFDGNGDYLSVDLGNNLIDSNTPFTLEFWMHPENISNRGILHFTNNPGTLETILYISGAGNLSWFDARVGSAAAGDITPNSGGGITTNEWHHIALTRQSDNYVRIYVDGQLYNTSFNVWDLGLSRYLEVGRYANTAYFDGYVSDIRIIEGTAVYTEDFTPSTAPLEAVTGTSLLLSGNNAAIRDESQSVESISVFGNTTVVEDSPYGTGKSMTFDGNGDHLDIAGSSSLEFGSSDFTIELWLNINSVGLYALTDPRTSGSSHSPLIWTKSTGELYYYTAGGDRIVGSTQLSVNTWHHVALTKYNGTTTLYLNGSSEGSFSDSYTYEQPTNFRIGRRYTPNGSNNSFDLDGKIADLRIVKGAAVYTENFSVPTAPLGDYSESAPAPEPAPEPTLARWAVVGVQYADLGFTNSGAVYVYDVSDLSVQPTKLVLSGNGRYNHQFGSGVAATADKIVVGVPHDDDNGTDSGAVYVYDANDLSATPTKLTSFDGAEYDRFGKRVAATSDKIVVGAETADVFAPTDNVGAVYVYDANDLSAQPTKLTPFDGAAGDQFGSAVAVAADKIVVGAHFDDDNGNSSGSVYVYDANDLTAQPTKLTPFDGAQGDYFGYSVAATADKVVVGAMWDDDNGSNSGSVYVYDANDLSAQPTKLTAFDGAASDYFGYAVAVAADKIMVGAYGDDDNVTDSGSVYIYDANDLSAQPTKIISGESDNFGISLAAFSDKIIVGAPINNNYTGTAYVYDANDLSAQPTKLLPSDLVSSDWAGFSVAIG